VDEKDGCSLPIPTLRCYKVHCAVTVPTVSDRIARTVVKLVLGPILEPVFDEDSYGYRPGRSALDAVAVTRKR
jgi:retron-type reverse transcriptase